MRRLDSPRAYLGAVSAALFILAIVGYTIFEARYLILGPTIRITEPVKLITEVSSPTTIAGNAKNLVRISLNDRPIFVDESGNFNEKLLLQEGYTIMRITAEDRFGRKTSTLLHFVRN